MRITLSVLAVSMFCASLRSATPTPPLLKPDLFQCQPRLTWTNGLGESYQILSRDELGHGTWLHLLNLPTYGKSAT